MAHGPVRDHRRSAKAPARAPAGRAAGRSAARQAQRRRRQKVVKVVAISLASVVLLGAGAAFYVYHQLNGNIQTTAISSKNKGVEKKDALGRSPINILAMGSDARNSAADCKLGGACKDSSGARADVEMVVHISADRSNATVMSIPRDLVTDLPACTDEKSGRSVAARQDMINSALDYGANCQVAAVHQLTGIPIDHFVEVDFAGVVSMSNAVGGVPVCVNHNVYDPQSHLKLSANKVHILKDVAALQFLRTRHGFGDGSDNIGRTSGQHIFLSAMINQLKSAGTLSSPTKLYKLANAATKSLTVDTGLGSIPKLIDLAEDLSKVPTKRITFTTMQNNVDPANTARVLEGPDADTLFRTIANDQPLTDAAGKKTGTTAPTVAPVDKSTVSVHVENGTSTIGWAGTVLKKLTDAGFSPSSTAGNADAPTATTTLTYPAGQVAQAKAVATALGLPTSHVKQGTGDGIVLLLGADWTTGDTFPGGHPAPVDTKKALTGALAYNGGDKSTCVQVSTQRTIASPTGGITPEQSYARHPEIKDSAP
ncbi:LCP family protein [Streptomyces sp. NBC_01476]|uniref:LCP family protein n=1 Tax=Streptomyces sp. NBC_01476 TaxID=2903881 RepID=UPI002E2F933A|nr:LCP family protein [Streptomyces sp. NBC_01476]